MRAAVCIGILIWTQLNKAEILALDHAPSWTLIQLLLAVCLVVAAMMDVKELLEE